MRNRSAPASGGLVASSGGTGARVSEWLTRAAVGQGRSPEERVRPGGTGYWSRPRVHSPTHSSGGVLWRRGLSPSCAMPPASHGQCAGSPTGEQAACWRGALRPVGGFAVGAIVVAALSRHEAAPNANMRLVVGLYGQREQILVYSDTPQP